MKNKYKWVVLVKVDKEFNEEDIPTEVMEYLKKELGRVDGVEKIISLGKNNELRESVLEPNENKLGKLYLLVKTGYDDITDSVKRYNLCKPIREACNSANSMYKTKNPDYKFKFITLFNGLTFKPVNEQVFSQLD